MTMIRRSVYIGFGEVGVNAVLHTKKMYEEAFGEGNVPEQIQFVPIESYDRRERWRHFYYVDELEIAVERDGRKLDYMMFERNTNSILDAVSNAVRKAGLHSGSQQIIGGEVDIHVVCALGGGLGSGAFLPLAVMLRKRFGKGINLYGYGLRCKLYAIPIEKQRLYEHAALLELDYFQSATSSAPVTIRIDRRPFDVYEPPFDRYYLIDEQTESGKIFDSRSLSQAVAIALYFHGAEAGLEVNNVLSSVDWRRGDYDCYNKKGWVHRLGVFEVVYDGGAVARRYSLLVKTDLLSQLSDSNNDVSAEAQLWKDNLIERIHSLKSPSSLGDVMIAPSHTYEDVRLFVKKYLEGACSEDFSFVRRDTICSLRDKVECLCNKIGFCGAKNFLVAIRDTVSVIRTESSAEIDKYKSAIHVSSVQLEDVLVDYCNYLKRIFKRRAAKLEYLNCIAQKAKQTLEYRVELMRQEAIVEIFVSINSEISSLLDKIEAILVDVAHLRKESAEALGPFADRICPFTYDISYDEQITLGVDSSDVALGNFVASLAVPLVEMTKQELNRTLDDYVSSLPRCDKYRSTQLEDVIAGLSSQEYEHFKEEISMRAAAFLPVEFYRLADKMNEFLFISMHKNDVAQKSRLEEDTCLMPSPVNCHFIPSCHPEMKQRMLLLRIDAAIIPYAVESTSVAYNYETFYSIDRYNPQVERFCKIIRSRERVEQARDALVSVKILDNLLKTSDINQQMVQDWVRKVNLLSLSDEDAVMEIRNACADYLRHVACVSNLIFFLGELMTVCSGHAALVNEITEQLVRITAIRNTLWSVRSKSLDMLRRSQLEIKSLQSRHVLSRRHSRHEYILPGTYGLDPVEVDFYGFISMLNASIGDMTEEDICTATKQYADTMPYLKKHILEMLGSLSDEDATELERTVKCDLKQQNAPTSQDSYWLILTYFEDPKKNPGFKIREHGSNVRYLYTDRVEMKDTVAIYQCKCDFSPSDADRVIEYLLNPPFNPHIDSDILLDMRRRDFMLRPLI